MLQVRIARNRNTWYMAWNKSADRVLQKTILTTLQANVLSVYTLVDEDGKKVKISKR